MLLFLYLKIISHLFRLINLTLRKSLKNRRFSVAQEYWAGCDNSLENQAQMCYYIL